MTGTGCNMPMTPGERSEECRRVPDGKCELLELPSYKTEDASCLRLPRPLLFRASRGRVPSFFVASFPVKGESVVLRPPRQTLYGSHVREFLRDALPEAGLTASEAAAFECAWQTELFEHDTGGPRDYVFYLLPQAAIDPYARLFFRPAPSRLVRVMAVRNELATNP